MLKRGPIRFCQAQRRRVNRQAPIGLRPTWGGWTMIEVTQQHESQSAWSENRNLRVLKNLRDKRASLKSGSRVRILVSVMCKFACFQPGGHDINLEELPREKSRMGAPKALGPVKRWLLLVRPRSLRMFLKLQFLKPALDLVHAVL